MTTVEPERSMTVRAGAPSSRSLLTSLSLHLVALIVLMLIPAEALRRTERAREVDVVFHRPRPPVAVPAAAALPPGHIAAGPRPEPKPARPSPPPAPQGVPKGPAGTPEAEVQPQQKVGNAGILAFREKLASIAQDKVATRLGADARLSDADAVGKPSPRSMLTTNAPGSSGGINVASLSRGVGGAGGAGGGGGSGGIQGLPVGHATSSIASIGGGDRPLAHGGPGPSRTDEEIQIVFDRYKASFYRLYNRALRNDPTLKGQMVLRLTIEPDGSVSMCALQSTDMDAPDLATQVVGRVRTINFGAKDGVPAVTIVYPIDFLPAA